MTQFKVSGMSCDHCVKSVTRAIQDVSPKAAVSVDLKQGLVDVKSDLEPTRIASAIEDAGYSVVGTVQK
jgi:copper chaperone